MAFTIASAPHGHSQQTTTTMMRMVLLALLPGVAVQVHFFGYGVIIQLLLATLTTLLTESLVLLLRQRPIGPALRDSSAILTAALLAVALLRRWPPGGWCSSGDGVCDYCRQAALRRPGSESV